MAIREKKPLSWFKTKSNVRHSLTAMQEMIESMKANGQLQDVAALADGTLIFGHRRLAAAGPAGLDGLWTKIYEEGLKAGESRGIQLTENLQREDLNSWEIAVAVRAMVEEDGLDQKAVAFALGKTQVWVSRKMMVWKCVPAVIEAYKAGHLGDSDIEVMSRVLAQEQLELLAKKSEGASRDELVRRVQRKRNGQSNAVQVNRIRFPLPSGVVITLAGQGLTMDGAYDAVIQGGKEIKKGMSEGLDARTFQSAMVCKVKGSNSSS